MRHSFPSAIIVVNAVTEVARVLIVEDEPDTSDFIGRKLKQLNHAVDAAFDGKEALNFLDTVSYDLVILDRTMPGPDGIAVLKHLRSQNNQAKVLMLTRLADIADKIDGFSAGADDYLAKPFDMRELEARVKALLSRPNQIANRKLSVGQLELNPDSSEVRIRGSVVRLQPQDFALLEFLMRHPREVFSAETLLNRVWSFDSNASIDGLRVSISRIRKLIDLPGQEFSVIENVNRVGYRLRAPE